MRGPEAAHSPERQPPRRQHGAQARERRPPGRHSPPKAGGRDNPNQRGGAPRPDRAANPRVAALFEARGGNKTLLVQGDHHRPAAQCRVIPQDGTPGRLRPSDNCPSHSKCTTGIYVPLTPRTPRCPVPSGGTPPDYRTSQVNSSQCSSTASHPGARTVRRRSPSHQRSRTSCSKPVPSGRRSSRSGNTWGATVRQTG